MVFLKKYNYNYYNSFKKVNFIKIKFDKFKNFVRFLILVYFLIYVNLSNSNLFLVKFNFFNIQINYDFFNYFYLKNNFYN